MSTKSKQDGRSTMTGLMVLVASLAAVAGILFGYDTGVIAGARIFMRYEFNLTPYTEGEIVAAVLLGAMLGSLVSGYFADHFGRRRMLIFTALLFLAGTIGYSLTNSVNMLILCRGLVGIAIGISSYTAPLYISELAPMQYRGLLVSLNQLMITLGILIAYLVDAYYAPTQNWRAMLAMGCVPALTLLISMIFLPESPRWLLLSGDARRAAQVLKRVRRGRSVSSEIDEIKNSIQDRGEWRVLLQPWLRPALLIGLGLGFFQQFTGINTLIYYAPTIFKAVGYQQDTAAILATIGIGVVNVLATVAALPLLDKVGRKPLLYAGVTAMLVSLSVLSLAFFIDPGSPIWREAAMYSMVVFIIGFAIGLGPVMWLMFAEIFPLEIRGVATSLVVAASWLFNGLVAWSFLPLLKYIGGGPTFLGYAVVCVIALVFIGWKVPETRGVSLEQIENNLRNGVPSRDLGSSH